MARFLGTLFLSQTRLVFVVVSEEIFVQSARELRFGAHWPGSVVLRLPSLLYFDAEADGLVLILSEVAVFEFVQIGVFGLIRSVFVLAAFDGRDGAPERVLDLLEGLVVGLLGQRRPFVFLKI